ncbi:uncharacterized protein LOC131066941 isoform X2 [Cryptomeria japonica]|uniref:uncharacterized protein LOC131066941 isoform X2 n=1 Tax=Cryptomeria japonica TaxID=3369 RepID=UPI0027D9EB9C|nr:uncharacterized protein LOC131066941 isoform X2 [Cryptomeria japonica]
MASVLGLKCSSMSFAPINSAVVVDSSYGCVHSTSFPRKTELKTSFGGFCILSASIKKHGNHDLHKSIWTLRAASEEGGVVKTEQSDEPISLGTMKLPPNVDLKKMETLLFQVEKVKGGVRLGFIRVNEGKVEDLVHIDCLIFPATEGSPAMFRALRDGKLKNETPPGESSIMQRLLPALKKSINLASS